MVNPRVLLIQPQAASHGVTLTAADTVIFWSPVMSVETYLQCIARIDRVGQKNKMTVIHLQGSEVEKRMYTMLQNKVDLHEKLVDLYNEELEDE
jgi:SNF2 family DNA or RNA helicase